MYMTLRHLRELWRQPWSSAVTLVQPVIWLLLFGALFKKVIEIPGFHGPSYIAFLAPGVVVMTALFDVGLERDGADRRPQPRRHRPLPGLAGAPRGADRRAASSRRPSLSCIQSVIIVVLALIVGACVPGRRGGVVVLFVVSALLGATFGALSNGFALIMRQRGDADRVVQFVVLPLTFLSSTFLQHNLMPTWIAHVADFNPVNWAVVAGRTAVSANPDWGVVASRAGFLLALLVVCLAFATSAFRTYQRSV